MNGSKIMVLGLTALLLGLLIPLMLYNTFYPDTGTTSTHMNVNMEANIPEIKDMQSFTSYIDLFNYLSIMASPSTIMYRSETIIESLGKIQGVSPRHTSPSTTTGAHMITGETPNRYSETNVQVIGIDEPDIVKTNGRVIAVAKENSVFIIDAVKDEVVGKIVLNESINSVYITDNYLVVLTIQYGDSTIVRELEINGVGTNIIFQVPRISSIIHVYNISNPKQPAKLYSISISGRLNTSRLKGGILYVITQQPVTETIITIPIIAYHPLPPTNIYLIDEQPSSYTNIIALNISNSQYSAYSFLISSSTWVYMSHQHLVLATSSPYWTGYIEQVINIVLKHLPEEEQDKIRSLIQTHRYYEAIHIINNYFNELGQDARAEILNRINADLNELNLTDYTKLYILGVDQLSLTYRGEVVVPGKILDQFSIEEYKGKYLIAATTVREYHVKAKYYEVNIYPTITPHQVAITITDSKGTKTYTLTVNRSGIEYGRRGYFTIVPISIKKYNQLTIIDLNNLNTISELSGIAYDEDIKASRLVGDLFILVTYRQIDPLFAINISDPENPEILGFLEIPGYNEYLHPITNTLIMGIGIEGDKLMVSLYDISDPRNIKEVAKATFTHVSSPVLYDYHAFTIDPEKKLLFIPLARFFYRIQGGWAMGGEGIAVIKYSNSSLIVVKIIEHPYASRALYIDDKLYSISPFSVKVLDEDSLEEIKTIVLK